MQKCTKQANLHNQGKKIRRELQDQHLQMRHPLHSSLCMELHVQAKENWFKWPLTVVQNFCSSPEQEMYVYIPAM